MKTKSCRRSGIGLAPHLQCTLSIGTLSNAERCQRYRKKHKDDPLYREAERLRQQQRRLTKTLEQQQRDRETARNRMRRLRDKRQHLKEMTKEPNQATPKSTQAKPMTRHLTKEKQQKWREAKRKYREGLSAQKKRRIREADKARKQSNVFQKSSVPETSANHTTPYTPEAARKAIYRAKFHIPKNPDKYAHVVKGLITSVTPKKRKAIEREIPQAVDTPRKRRRIEFLQRAMGSFKDQYEKLKQSRKSKDSKTRKVLATHLARIRKYRLLKFCSNEVGIRYKSLLKWSRLDSNCNSKSKRVDALSDELVQKVQDFYVKPSVSVTHATKKTVLKKQMKQRHTLNYSLSAAHKQFRQEHQSSISFSKFASLKPKNVETVGKRIYRGCLCEQCTNIELLLKGINKKLKHQEIIHDKYAASDLTLCEYEKGSHPKLQCVKRECDLCGTRKIRAKFGEVSESDEVVWYQWESKKIPNEKTKVEKSRKLLVQHVGTLEELVEIFVKNMESFSNHLFVAHWQHRQFQKAKEGLDKGQVLCVMDFAENMTLRNQGECQSAHWFAQQVTIHPIVCYHIAEDKETDERQLVTHEVVFISDDLTHDAHMVEHCVTETLRLLRDTLQLTHMIQFTDGCSAQYKSKTPFADVSCSEADHGVKIERHFFGTSHGKGPADGCSGVVKAALSRALKAGTVLNSGTEMHAFCKKSLTKSTESFRRTFVYVDSNTINRKRPDRIAAITVKGTRQLHAVKPSEPGTLAVRQLSCFCAKCLYDIGECPNSDVVDNWKIEGVLQKLSKTRSKLPQKDGILNQNVPQKVGTEKHDSEKPKVPQKVCTDKPENREKEDSEATTNPINVQRQQYFSGKLKELHKLKSFVELQKKSRFLKPEFDALFPIQANDSINITDSKLTSDKVALQLFPNDVKDKCSGKLPVIVVADGNCLPRCGSILAFGHELAHEEFRARIAVEMACSESTYTENSYLNRGVTLPENEKRNLCKTYTMFSDKYMNEVISKMTIKRIFRQEVMDVTRLGSYMGVWQLFALSTVLKCPIRSIYPSLGAAVPRLLLNRLILPAFQTIPTEVNIMWSSSRSDMGKEHWIPNHFVPVLYTCPVIGVEDFDFDIDTSFNLSDIVDGDDIVASAITELMSEENPDPSSTVTSHPDVDIYIEKPDCSVRGPSPIIVDQSASLDRSPLHIIVDQPASPDTGTPTSTKMDDLDNSVNSFVDNQSASPDRSPPPIIVDQPASPDTGTPTSTKIDDLDNSVNRFVDNQSASPDRSPPPTIEDQSASSDRGPSPIIVDQSASSDKSPTPIIVDQSASPDTGTPTSIKIDDLDNFVNSFVDNQSASPDRGPPHIIVDQPASPDTGTPVIGAEDFDYDIDTSFNLSDIVDGDDIVASAITELMSEENPDPSSTVTSHPDVDIYIEKPDCSVRGPSPIIVDQSASLDRSPLHIIVDQPASPDTGTPTSTKMDDLDNSVNRFVDNQSASPDRSPPPIIVDQPASPDTGTPTSTKIDDLDNSVNRWFKALMISTTTMDCGCSFIEELDLRDNGHWKINNSLCAGEIWLSVWKNHCSPCVVREYFSNFYSLMNSIVINSFEGQEIINIAVLKFIQ